MDNIENSLIIAVINPNYYGHKVFAMFHVKEQIGDILKVNAVWDMSYMDSNHGRINPVRNTVKELHISDVWAFVNSLTPFQKSYFEFLELDYHFHKDENALERLAEKLDMNRIHIGYDNEPENGSWFIDCRITGYLPQGLYIYSLRAADNGDNQPCSIESRVLVNHYGDILTDQPLSVPIKL